MVDDNVVEEPTDHEEIGLPGFDFNLFDEDKEVLLDKGQMSFHIY